MGSDWIQQQSHPRVNGLTRRQLCQVGGVAFVLPPRGSFLVHVHKGIGGVGVRLCGGGGRGRRGSRGLGRVAQGV